MLSRRNVLIFHLGALGDFVLTWPLAVALGRLHPQSRIFYVTHGSKGKLAEKALGIDSIDVEGGWHALYGEVETLPPEVDRRLNSAHTILSFVSDGSDGWAKNVRRLAPEATLLPIAMPPRGDMPDGHVIESLLRQLQPLAALATATDQIVRSVAARGIGGRGTPDGRTLIHPGSGGAAKCWSVDRFVEVASRLKAEGKQVVFVIGEAELERWPKAEIEKLSAVGAVEAPKDLVALYSLIRTASLFIGNDSGPGHLAGIVGVPTIVIFGGGGLQSWKPLGPGVKVVAGETLEAITVEQVMGAISG